jgi:(2Fe-2S) ferredoxin
MKKLLICQHISCRGEGSLEVLRAFRERIPNKISIEEISCLGECGNGPMILILPEQIWYARVKVDRVPLIIAQHLEGGKPVRALLYTKFHQPKPNYWLWSAIAALAIIGAIAAGIIWGINRYGPTI